MAVSNHSRHLSPALLCEDDEEEKAAHVIETLFMWLPPPNPPGAEKFCRGLIEMLRTKPMSKSLRIWNLLEMSMPPLLARKYHTINTLVPTDGKSTDKHYIEVVMWFIMWSNTFNLQFLNSIQLQQKKLTKIYKNVNSIDKNITEWQLGIDITLLFMEHSRKIKSAPIAQDNVQKVGEFLLEHCIIIQLPWNNVLLHQWLAAALVEVLIFEKSSLELRHWPLPPELEPTARELLTLVKQLKERIVLGFAIMSQQVAHYPLEDLRHPGWILDEVVLPSLTTLKFLITSKANNILKSIKKLAWSQHEALTDRMYISPSCYIMDNFLANFFFKFCYNFPIWEMMEIPPPFPSENVTSKDLENVIIRLKTNTPDVPNCIGVMFNHKPLSLEEKFIAEIVEGKQKYPDYTHDNESLFSVSLATIENVVFNTGRISEEMWEKVLQIFIPSNQYLSDCFTNYYEIPLSDKQNLQIVIHCVLQCWEFHTMLHGCEQEKSAMSRIINMGIRMFEQEQIIKMSLALCVVFQVCPIATNIENATILTNENMTLALLNVRNTQIHVTRNWLWNLFPSSWNEPIERKDIKLTDLNIGEVVKITQNCEKRIGRLVVNVARDCFNVYENGGVIYPYWQIVQYLLPCLNVAFMQSVEGNGLNTHRSSSIMHLINTMLCHYEEFYLQWIAMTKMKINDNTNFNLLNLKDKTMLPLLNSEFFHITNYYMKLIKQYMDLVNGSCNSRNEKHEFFHVESGLLEWPYNFVKTVKLSLPCYTEMYVSCFGWLELALNFLKEVHSFMKIAWRLPVPGVVTKYAPYGEYYLADSILQALKKVYASYLEGHIKSHKDSPMIRKICDEIAANPPVNDLVCWRNYIMYHVTVDSGPECEERIPYIDSQNANMVKLYENLRRYRKWVGKTASPLIIKNLPIEIQNFAFSYLYGKFDILDIIFNNIKENVKIQEMSKIPKTIKSSEEATLSTKQLIAEASSAVANSDEKEIDCVIIEESRPCRTVCKNAVQKKLSILGKRIREVIDARSERMANNKEVQAIMDKKLATHVKPETAKFDTEQTTVGTSSDDNNAKFCPTQTKTFEETLSNTDREWDSTICQYYTQASNDESKHVGDEKSYSHDKTKLAVEKSSSNIDTKPAAEKVSSNVDTKSAIEQHFSINAKTFLDVADAFNHVTRSWTEEDFARLNEKLQHEDALKIKEGKPIVTGLTITSSPDETNSTDAKPVDMLVITRSLSTNSSSDVTTVDDKSSSEKISSVFSVKLVSCDTTKSTDENNSPNDNKKSAVEKSSSNVNSKVTVQNTSSNVNTKSAAEKNSPSDPTKSAVKETSTKSTVEKRPSIVNTKSTVKKTIPNDNTKSVVEKSLSSSDPTKSAVKKTFTKSADENNSPNDNKNSSVEKSSSSSDPSKSAVKKNSKKSTIKKTSSNINTKPAVEKTSLNDNTKSKDVQKSVSKSWTEENLLGKDSVNVKEESSTESSKCFLG